MTAIFYSAEKLWMDTRRRNAQTKQELRENLLPCRYKKKIEEEKFFLLIRTCCWALCWTEARSVTFGCTNSQDRNDIYIFLHPPQFHWKLLFFFFLFRIPRYVAVWQYTVAGGVGFFATPKFRVGINFLLSCFLFCFGCLLLALI